MRGQTIILAGESQRQFAKGLIDKAPANAVLNIKAATRSNSQNSRMWAMLSEVSRSKPQERCHTPERWRFIFMQSLGYSTQFELDLDGNPFAIGLSTSKLSVSQMADLIELIYAYGAQNGVVFHEPRLPNEAA